MISISANDVKLTLPSLEIDQNRNNKVAGDTNVKLFWASSRIFLFKKVHTISKISQPRNTICSQELLPRLCVPIGQHERVGTLTSFVFI